MKRTQVVLLGDSISLGYRSIVRSMLKDSVKIVYPREQGKSAADIYRMLYEWSNELVDNANEVNLVYWNAGLWDVVNIYNEGVNTEISIYKSYLIKVCNRLKSLFPNAKICFANTTHVIENRYDDKFKRSNEEICRYNRIAEEVLAGNVDYIDDLFSMTKQNNEADYVDATHFDNNANMRLANHVCGVIKELLSKEINQFMANERVLSEKKNNILNSLPEENRICVAAWGAGNIFQEYKNIIEEYCDLSALVDKDKRLHGKLTEGLICVSPYDIPQSVQLVVITIDNVEAILDITDFCIDRNIICCTYSELMDYVWPLLENKKLGSNTFEFQDVDPNAVLDMQKYVGVSIPENVCNLDCSYCYLQLIPYRRNINIRRKNPHSAEYIRFCFSRERLGGSCLIGLTGSGETFFADNFEQVCLELLKEGHYLHIVTNGILTEQIKALITKSGDYSKNIIFKLSFHYLELKKKKMLKRFNDTVHAIEESDASFSIEIMPHDELIPYIPEILEYSKNNFGAYPHLTIGRNEKDGAKLLTNLSYSEFYNVWKVFDSEMFEMRMKLYMTKGKRCKAGKKSLFVDLYSGRISRCIFAESIGNIYFDEIQNFDEDEVGDNCPLNYCFNCHVYATLGVLPMDNVPTYMEIRDRIKDDGKHWLKENMQKYLDIKL